MVTAVIVVSWGEERIEGLSGERNQADGNSRALEALAAVSELAASVEVATPGVGGTELFVGPVPFGCQGALDVGKQQRSDGARRQLAALLRSPGDGLLPGQVLAGDRQQDHSAVGAVGLGGEAGKGAAVEVCAEGGHGGEGEGLGGGFHGDRKSVV